VATVATVIVMASYVVVAIVLNLVVVHRLTSQADVRLSERLADAGRLSITEQKTGDTLHRDEDDAPTFVWRVSASGSSTALTPGAPSFPHLIPPPGASTVDIGSTPFRVKTASTSTQTLVAGESIAAIDRVRSALAAPEFIFGLILLLLTFAGSLIIGLRASAPLELVRRRQAEFTADASHELRTPLSVIEAEVDLALRRGRSPDEYRSVLGRVAGEGRRLRRIVDDLLWLARVDDRGMKLASDTAVDVADMARACTDRFQALAATREVTLALDDTGPGPLWVRAEPEWIDRLIGVLVDNACKYAGPGGRATVRVQNLGNRIVLQVDDSGPGIPPDQRSLVMDRFHRADEEHPGTGLGLAIADTVVRATNGTWLIGESPAGGARMQVSWRKTSLRHAGTTAASTEQPTPAGRPHAPEPTAAGPLPR
jgi:signal transduction histidine kinase